VPYATAWPIVIIIIIIIIITLSAYWEGIALSSVLYEKYGEVRIDLK
jgi:hypothetical protein